jgi:hypothetical protein
MKFKVTGIEIESDKIISEVYLNVRYENDEKTQEEEIKLSDEIDDQIEPGSIFKSEY